MQSGEGGRWTSSSREEGGSQGQLCWGSVYMQALCVYNHIVHIRVMFESHVCMQVCTYMQCNQARLVSIRNCIAPIFWTQCVYSTGSVGQIYTRSSCSSSLSPSEAASIWTFVPCCTWSLFFLQCSFREKTLYHYVYISDPARGVTFRSFFHFLQVKVFVKALIFLLMFFCVSVCIFDVN